MTTRQAPAGTVRYPAGLTHCVTPTPSGTCGHLDVVHHLTPSGARTACTVHDGPRAIPCGCPRFTPEEVS